MTTCFTATPGVDVITTTADIPALGSLAINAFVLHGSEPVLVDTGTVAGTAEFMSALTSVIDPGELRWIWLTHTDFDHIGSLSTLLDANPELRVITSFLGVGIMGLSSTPLPMDRVHLVNPGQSVTVGDRRLTAVKPPVYDNPITTGFVDDRTGILFSSDCFGALLPAVPQAAADLDTDELRAGQVRWATIDSAWVHDVDRDAFGHALDRLRAIEPSMVCSSHLPPAPGAMLEPLPRLARRRHPPPAASSAPTRPPSKRCSRASSPLPPESRLTLDPSYFGPSSSFTRADEVGRDRLIPTDHRTAAELLDCRHARCGYVRPRESSTDRKRASTSRRSGVGAWWATTLGHPQKNPASRSRTGW